MPAEPLPDPHLGWLAEYDDALASGLTPPADASPAAVLADDRALLHMLDQLRLRHPPPAGVGAAEARYVLRRLHASGGIGQVWLAYDTDLDRDVALKVLRPERETDPLQRSRFLHEARLTSRLQHPGIVPVYEMAPGEADPAEESPFFTMRLVQGRTLSEAITAYHERRRKKAAGPLELRSLLDAFVAVCNTVAYAHSRGVIHRDLKGPNVVLGDYGEVIVLDWGLAKVQGQPDPPSCERSELPASMGSDRPTPDPCPRRCGRAATDTNEAAEAPGPYTLSGTVLGTVAYMAPEQAEGRSHDVGPRTDVFGLGAILYEILTGQPPYAGDRSTEQLRQARAGAAPAAAAVCPGVPRALEAISRKALARDPADRYGSATEVADEVRHWLADEPVRAYREPLTGRLGRWARRHRVLVAGLSALFLTAILAVSVGLVLLRQEQARTAEARAQAAIDLAESTGLAERDAQRRLYFHRLALAERTLTASNPGRSLQLLTECPPELRGWEWHCLQRLCHADSVALEGHKGTVAAVAFDRDGRLASAGFDHTIRIWDEGARKEKRVLAGHRGVVYDLAFHPDGRTLASAGWDSAIKLWDADTGRLLLTLEHPGGHVDRVLFAPDGRRLFSLGTDNVLRVWDADTGRLLYRFDNDGPEPWHHSCMAISPDGRVLALGGVDPIIRLVDAGTGKRLGRLEAHRNLVRALAFSPDGRLLAAGDGEVGRRDPGEVRVWDLAAGKVHHTFRGHTDPVFRVAFHPTQPRLVSASLDHTIKVWDLESGQEALTLHGHTDAVRAVAFSPDGTLMASAGADRVVRLWDGTPWERERPAYELASVRGPGGRVFGVAHSPDGRRLALTGDIAALEVRDEAGEVVWARALGKVDCFAAAFSPDGATLATATSDGLVRLFDPDTGRQRDTRTGHANGPIRGLAFFPDGQTLATAGWDRTVRLWDLRGRRQPRVLQGHAEPVVGVAVSPDGKRIASASNDRTVRVWDAADGREVKVLPGHDSAVLAVAFSPTQSLLASAGNDGAVKLWDTRTWKAAGGWAKHNGGVWTIAFRPDGRYLASAGLDWTVRVWRVATGELVRTLHGHTDRVHGLSFHPSGLRLVSVSFDGLARTWDLSDLPD